MTVIVNLSVLSLTFDQNIVFVIKKSENVLGLVYISTITKDTPFNDWLLSNKVFFRATVNYMSEISGAVSEIAHGSSIGRAENSV